MTSDRAAPVAKPDKPAPSLAPTPEAGRYTAGATRARDRRPPGDDAVHWLLGGADDMPVQRKPIDPGYGDIVAAAGAIARGTQDRAERTCSRCGATAQHPTHAQVQAKCSSCEARSAAAVHAAARDGLVGAAQPLPHAERIQAAFGRHDVSDVQTVIGGSAQTANDRMGAAAFTSGRHIAFREAPDLGLAAHEAAHVVQQRAGLQLRDGVGTAGDRWERHADRVSNAVVAGHSAEPVLDEVAPASRAPTFPEHAPAIQRDVPTSHADEDKDAFAARVKSHAASRLTENIAVLAKWSSYIAAMEGFQLRAQMLTNIAREFEIAGAATPAGREHFEVWAGTDNAAERGFRGSQLDITSTYQGRVGNFVEFLASKTQGFDTSPSVAENFQVLAGDRTPASLPRSRHVGPDVRYSEYAEPIRKAQHGEIGGCQFCHEVNYAWGRTAARWGSPLPRGDFFEDLATSKEHTAFFSSSGGAASAPLSAGEMRALTAWVQGNSGDAGPPAIATGAPPANTAPHPPMSIAVPQASQPPPSIAVPQASQLPPSIAAPNPFAPEMAIPVAVPIPPPRTALCGELPDAKDAARIPRVTSWGPNSAIVEGAIAHIDAVLTPLGPRGYRVLGAQDFDALYGVAPDAMEGVRAQIIGRIAERSDQYAKLRADILAGGVPYEELCPIVDELLPSTNPRVQFLALQDVHDWQRRERLLLTLELVLLALSVMFPPAAIVTVPAGMALGLSRMSLGFDQQRQGRQWTQGTGAGLYSLQQEAEAPGLAERGRQNIIGGAFEFGTSALTSGVMAARMITAFRDARELAALLRALQDGAVITSPKFPGLTLHARGGYLLMVNEANEILGFGQIANGQISFTKLPFPWVPTGGAGAGTSAMVPFGGSTAMVPFGGELATTPGSMFSMAPRGPLWLPAGRTPLLLGPGSHVPPSWVATPEFNALAPHELPMVGLPDSGAQWVRQPDGSWGLQVPYGSAPGASLTTFGAGPQASFVIDVPNQSATFLTTPRTGATYTGSRSYPMQPVAMTDPATGVVGARSHGIPHADSPSPTPASPGLSTAAPNNYVDHLSHVYNERVRRTLEQRFRAAGHRWTAYNPSYSPPRFSTGGFLIPEAEVIVEYGPSGAIRAWRFPNDPSLYASLPADFDTAIAPFEIPLANVPRNPVTP